MASWTTLTELFERLTHPGAHVGNLREEELRLAAAALLVHALAIDGEVANEERRKLNALLQTHFGLGDDETRRLIREAIVRDHGAVVLHRFTSVLCAQLDQNGRKQIIEMLWEIAMADRVVHEFESNLVCDDDPLLCAHERRYLREPELEAGPSPRAIKGLLDSVKFFLVAFEGGMWRHDAPPYLAGGSTIDELSQPPVPVIICDGSADRSRLD